jgi:phage terminase small subunit
MGFENCGRKPKPTAVHILNGNPSRKNLRVIEPKPPRGDLEKPATLSVGAGVVWDELVPILTYMGTLTTADLRPFAAMCELQASFTANAMRKDTDPEHFRYSVESDLSTKLRPFYEYFGMTPSARARLAVPQPKDAPVSKWAGAV